MPNSVRQTMSFGGPKLPPETDAIINDVLNSELPEVVVGETGSASSAGLNIWYERITLEGPPQGTVLLLMGSGGDALIWPPGFVRAFVDAGYQVVRYDQRGTGASDWVEDWDRQNPYSVADMAGETLFPTTQHRKPGSLGNSILSLWDGQTTMPQLSLKMFLRNCHTCWTS